MIFYPNPIPCILLLFIAVFHILSVFVKNRWGSVCAYAGIVLHIALLASLIFLGAELSEAVLLFMSSLTFYVILYFINDKRKRGGNGS